MGNYFARSDNAVLYNRFTLLPRPIRLEVLFLVPPWWWESQLCKWDSKLFQRHVYNVKDSPDRLANVCIDLLEDVSKCRCEVERIEVVVVLFYILELHWHLLDTEDKTLIRFKTIVLKKLFVFSTSPRERTNFTLMAKKLYESLTHKRKSNSLYSLLK